MKKHGFARCGTAIALCVAAAYVMHEQLHPADIVIVNTINEPYEQVRERSRSTLPPYDAEGGFLNLYVKRPTIFRFNDPHYGFVTPPAKFLFIGAITEEHIDGVTLSPQKETLPLDASMRVLVGLQNQFRRGGWRPILVSDSPPIEDTPATRAAIRHCSNPITYWQAEDKLQIVLDIRCFSRDSNPDKNRYLITLQLAKPFVPDD